MKIRIKDVNKNPMWAIPDTSIFLSIGEVEGVDGNMFKEVDYAGLTPYQKQMLWASIRNQTIEAEDDADFQEDFRNVLKDYLNKRKKMETNTLNEFLGNKTSETVASAVENEQVLLNKVGKANDLKDVLENSVNTLKRLLSTYSASDLELCYKLEQYGKNRKTVLTLVQGLIEKQTKQNVSKIESPNAPTAEEYQARQIYKGMDKGLLSNISNVRESEKEQIIIKIGE